MNKISCDCGHIDFEVWFVLTREKDRKTEEYFWNRVFRRVFEPKKD